MPYTPVRLADTAVGDFLLPNESQATNRLLDTMDYNAQVAAQNQKLKQQYAQQIAQSYQDNMFKAKNGQLWNNELMGLQQKHIQQGIDYAKQGWDIYHPNPNNSAQMEAYSQYMADRAKLSNLQDVRGAIEKQYNDQNELYSKAPVGKYDLNSLHDMHNFVAGNNLSDIVAQGKSLPYLREAFDPEAHIGSKIKPVMTAEREFVSNGHKITTKQFMPKETARQVENLISGAPGGLEHVKQQTGLTPDEARQIPNKPQDLIKYNNDYLHSPSGQEELAKAGITDYNSPEYKQFLQAKSAQDFQDKQKYNAFVKRYVDRARAEANIIDKNIPDYDAENQAHKRAGWAKEKEDNFATPVFNTPDNVAVAKTGTGTTLSNGKPDKENPLQVDKRTGTSLVSFNIGNLKSDIIPAHVFNTETGDVNNNSSAIRLTGSTLKLKPILEYQKGGIKGRRILSDDQVEKINNGTFKTNSGIKATPTDIKYKYMLYGQQPIGKGQYKEVAVPWDESMTKSLEKKVNFDEAEAKLPPEVQVKLATEKVGRLYPQLTGQKKTEAIQEYLQARASKYNQ